MKIMVSIILYLLSETYGNSFKYGSFLDFQVSFVRFYKNKPFENNTLYVLNDAQDFPIFPKNSKVFFIASQNTSNDLQHQNQTAYFSIPRDDSTLLEEIYDLLWKLEQWDSALKDSLIKTTDIQKFFHLGEKYISLPYALFHRNFSILASSKSYKKYFTKEYQIPFESQVPVEQVGNMILDEFFHKAESFRTPFIYPTTPGENDYYYCINILKNNHFICRFLVCLPKKEQQINKGLALLTNHFAFYLKDLYQDFFEPPVQKHQNDQVHNIFRLLADNTLSLTDPEIKSALSLYNWKINDEFIIIKIIFFEYTGTDIVSVYLCSRLEKVTTDSCAIPYQNSVLWIINSKSFPENKIDSVFQSLSYTIREYVCKAGISDSFEDFRNAHQYIRQAETALNIGQIKDPHFWHYRFRDYIFPYILNQISSEYSPEDLCHSGLKKLIDYDEKNNTEFTETLKQYLQCNGNSSLAAKKMYIHRTSFIRRMDRIKDITLVNFSNQDELLHLMISFCMLSS